MFRKVFLVYVCKRISCHFPARHREVVRCFPSVARSSISVSPCCVIVWISVPTTRLTKSQCAQRRGQETTCLNRYPRWKLFSVSVLSILTDFSKGALITASHLSQLCAPLLVHWDSYWFPGRDKASMGFTRIKANQYVVVIDISKTRGNGINKNRSDSQVHIKSKLGAFTKKKTLVKCVCMHLCNKSSWGHFVVHKPD